MTVSTSGVTIWGGAHWVSTDLDFMDYANIEIQEYTNVCGQVLE